MGSLNEVSIGNSPVISCNIPCTQQESLQYDCYDGSQYCWNYDENVYCGCDLSPLLCSECENDDSGGSWLDCICEYSDINGTVSNYNSSSAMPYAIGDQLSFSDINVEFSTCYPDCNDTFSLSDYSGKKFLIIYEEDWWDPCFESIQFVENILINYIDNPNLAILYFLRETADETGFDSGGRRKCDLIGDEPFWPETVSWGDEGIEDFPIMVSVVLNHCKEPDPYPDQHTEIINWFGLSELDECRGLSPQFIFLDEDFYVINITSEKLLIEDILNSMLDN